MNSRIWAAIASFYLGACLLLGGASAAGAFANAGLQLLALVVILLLLWTGRAAIPSQARLLVWTIVLFVSFAAASLIPVPLSIWQDLPYRGELAEGLRLLGVQSGSLALSLAPRATIWSLLSLLPAIAMFLLVTALPAERRGALFTTLVALSVASIALGVLQLLGGPGSLARFYEITNRMSAVGFFANVNHNATLILCALPALAALAAPFARRRDRSRRSGGFVIAAACALFLLVGIGLMRSMAGYALILPALFASILIYRSALVAKVSAAWRAGFAALALVFVGIALMGPLSQERLSEKFSDYPSSRRTIAETSLGAIEATFPVGSGLGTYSDLYRRFQDPAQASREYVNHAHNDYLEIAVELGAPGLVLVLLFLFWWIRRSAAAWREDGDVSARAGSVMIGLVMLHSLVDYPIRTAAITALFAMACALLVPARISRRSPDSGNADRGDSRHLKVTGDEA